MAVDRLERLVNLVAALLDTDRPLTRQQIHDRIEGYAEDPAAFRRNFERDKELLRQMGLPLATVALDPSHPDELGYRIPREQYELPDPGLDEAELAALRLAASAVQVEGAWGREATTRALRKLGGAVAVGGGRPGGGDRGETGAFRGLAELPGGDAVAAAFAAVGERRRLRFVYRGEERLVDPWRLSLVRGQWYLAGLDHGRGEERLFRLDRVEGPVAPEGPAGAFERTANRAAEPAPAWRLGDEEEVVAELLVDAEQAPWALEALGAGAVSRRGDDGSMVFSVPVTNRAGFRSFVLGFLDHAEIVGPPSLRADIAGWLSALSRGVAGDG